MYEAYGTLAANPRALLSISEKTSWDSGEDLFSVNARYAQDPDIRTGDGVRNCLEESILAAESMTVAQFHEAFHQCIFPSARLRGDKTPDYGFFMAQLQTIWPKARFIHMLREGLPTARSMLKHPGCRLMVSAGFDNWCRLSFDRFYSHYTIGEPSLDKFVASWSRRVSRIRDESRRLKPGSYLEVEYEALLREPAKSLTEIAKFLGADAAEDWLNSCAARMNESKASYSPTILELAALSIESLRALHPLPLAKQLVARQTPQPLEVAQAWLDSGKAESAAFLVLSWLSESTGTSPDNEVSRAKSLLRRALKTCGHPYSLGQCN